MGGVDFEPVSRTLIETMFTNFDDTFREMGVSDVTVPKRIRKTGGVFYRRLAAYDAAIDADGSNTLVLLLRDIVAEGSSSAGPSALDANALAAYVGACNRLLDEQSVQSVADGEPDFAEVGVGQAR